MNKDLILNKSNNDILKSLDILKGATILFLIGYIILLLFQINRISGVIDPYVEILIVRIISDSFYLAAIISLLIGNILIVFSFKVFCKTIEGKYFKVMLINSIIMIVNTILVVICYILNLIILETSLSSQLLEEITFHYNLWVGSIILIVSSVIFFFIIDKSFTQINSKYGINLKIPSLYFGILPIAPIYLISLILYFSISSFFELFAIIGIIVYSLYFVFAPIVTIQLLVLIGRNYKIEMKLLEDKILSEKKITNI